MKVTRAQAEENRNRVLDVAGRLFRERGFDGIGIADLMKEAGLTHGGFYGNFESKEDLIVQVCDRVFGEWLHKGSQTHSEGSPFDRFVAPICPRTTVRIAAPGACSQLSLQMPLVTAGRCRSTFGTGIKSVIEMLSRWRRSARPTQNVKKRYRLSRRWSALSFWHAPAMMRLSPGKYWTRRDPTWRRADKTGDPRADLSEIERVVEGLKRRPTARSPPRKRLPDASGRFARSVPFAATGGAVTIMTPEVSLQYHPLRTFDKLRYADTDRQGHINNAVFATFLDTGRLRSPTIRLWFGLRHCSPSDRVPLGNPVARDR